MVRAEEGQKGDFGPAPSGFHGGGRYGGVPDAVVRPAEAKNHGDQAERYEKRSRAGNEHQQADNAQRDMKPKGGAVLAGGALRDQVNAKQGSHCQRDDLGAATPVPAQPGGGCGTEDQMKQDVRNVEESSRWQGRHVRDVQKSKNE